MYEVCMSADRRVSQNFDQTELSWEGEAPVSLGPEHLIYEEDRSNGISGLLMKSGLVILIAVSAFGGYQFLKGSSADQQMVSAKSANGWPGDALQEQEDQTQKVVRKIDLTTTGTVTGTVQKQPQHLGKPVPIKPENSGNTQFHVVQSGDTLSAISRKFKIKTALIMELNGIDNPRRIKPGMKLIVSR